MKNVLNAGKLILAIILFGQYAGSCSTLQRLSSAPYVSGDTFRAIADFVFDETRKDGLESANAGDILFIKGDLAQEFINTAFSSLQVPLVIVVHNSDAGMPGAFTSILDDVRIGHLFAQNLVSEHPKCSPIPIGLANRYWDHGNIERVKNAQGLQSHERNGKIYLNVRPESYPNERNEVITVLAKKSFCTYKPDGISYTSYLRDLAAHTFVAAPRGNGIDTHRLWEALLLGAYPIVKRCGIEKMYEDLPVIVVDAWDQITQSFLVKELTKLRGCQFDMTRIYCDYWINKIIDKKKEISAAW